MHGAKILTLALLTVDADALEAAEKLVDDIKSCKTVGCCIIAMHKTNVYSLDVAGACKKYPTATRGMVQALNDELAPEA